MTAPFGLRDRRNERIALAGRFGREGLYLAGETGD